MAALLEGRPLSRVKLGLGRTERMLARLGDPHTSYRSLHVAGTNGKGSVAAAAAAVLTAAGRSTGLYLSPHVLEFGERVQVDGSPAPGDLLESCAARVLPEADRVDASQFEALTVLAFLALAEAGVEWTVAEVGLGGRLDSTTVLRPAASAVTRVAMDHQEYLGDSLEEVAREMAGIVKPGTPVVLGPMPASAEDVLRARAAEAGAPARRLAAGGAGGGPPDGGADARVEEVRADLGSTAFRYVSRDRTEGVRLEVPLLGRHQAANCGLAILLLEQLDAPPEAAELREGLGRVRHPGRLQLVRAEGGRWLLDVAHNLDAAGVVADALEELDVPAPRVGLASVLRDKPWREMLERLSDRLDVLVCTNAPSAPRSRRWDLGEVRARLGERVIVAEELTGALGRCRELAEGGTVIVTGSTAVVRDALRRLGVA